MEQNQDVEVLKEKILVLHPVSNNTLQLSLIHI